MGVFAKEKSKSVSEQKIEHFFFFVRADIRIRAFYFTTVGAIFLSHKEGKRVQNFQDIMNTIQCNFSRVCACV